MFRSMFNDPKPANFSEMTATMSEMDVDTALAQAVIYSPDDQASAPFIGWTAEVLPTDATGENGFETAGWENRDELVNALRSAGVVEIEDENGNPI